MKRTIAKPAKRTTKRDQRRPAHRPKAKAKATRPRAAKTLRIKSHMSVDDGDVLPLSAGAVEERVRHVLRELLESLLRVMAGEAYASQVGSRGMPGYRPSPHEVPRHAASLGSPSDNDLLTTALAASASSDTVVKGWGADEVTADTVRATNDPPVVPTFAESDPPMEGDTTQEDALAQALLHKITMVSETARAKYTVLFYLRAIGGRGAFGGRTITLSSLPGENQKTKRERIWWLKNEGVVGSQSRSRLERVSLTPLGKKAWDLYRAVVPVDQASEVR